MGKRIVLVAILSFLVIPVTHAQKKTAKPAISRNEIKLSGGVLNLPNLNGSVTFSYMYFATKWLGVGLNASWQSPSDTETYKWREYDTDGNYKDFSISAQNKYRTIAPEIRIIFLNRKWATLHTGLSVGNGKSTGLPDRNAYPHWNITFIGGNWYIGRNRNFFVGGEFGVGFKGIYNLHTGIRF